ncbi:MAG: DUF2911 domain-containing protein [Myxococcota bacterium]
MRFVLTSAVCFAFVSPAWAQGLPAPSPSAMVKQTVGVTDVSVDYSSPAVKGRVILGKLLPFGEYWRAGANAATKVTFSHDVKFAGQDVKAGEYRLGLTPTRKGWMVALGTDTNTVMSLPEKEALVLNTAVKQKTIRSRERLTYLFENTTDTKTDLVLEWSTFKVILPISVGTEALVTTNLAQQERQAYGSMLGAGRYLTRVGKFDEAIAKFEKAKALNNSWRVHWHMAEAFAKKGDKGKALELAKSAQSMGKGERIYEQFFKTDVEEALVAWAK